MLQGTLPLRTNKPLFSLSRLDLRKQFVLAVYHVSDLSLIEDVAVLNMAIQLLVFQLEPKATIVEEADRIMGFGGHLLIVVSEEEVHFPGWDHAPEPVRSVLNAAQVPRSVAFEAEVYP